MRNKLSFICAMLLSTGAAFAEVNKTNYGTIINWNPTIVAQALTQVGITDATGAPKYKQNMYEHILKDLEKRQSFKVLEAESVCMKRCKGSDRECDDLCYDFVHALVGLNHEFVITGNIPKRAFWLVAELGDGTVKIFSDSEENYAICKSADAEELPATVKQHANLCADEPDGRTGKLGCVVFDAQANKPIALLGEAHGLYSKKCAIKQYAPFDFNATVEDDLSRCKFTITNSYLREFEYINSTVSKYAIKDCMEYEPLDREIVKKYVDEEEYNNSLQKLQKCKDAIAKWQALGLTQTSLDKYDELNDFSLNYRSDLYWKNPNEEILGAIDGLKQKNGSVYDLTKLRVKNEKEAIEIAKREILDSYNDKNARWIDRDKFKCSHGNAKPASEIICVIDDLTYTVRFDFIPLGGDRKSKSIWDLFF